MDKIAEAQAIIRALGHPDAWSLYGPPARTSIAAWIRYKILERSCDLLVRHESGFVVRVERQLETWAIRHADKRYAFARIPCSAYTRSITFKDFQDDLDRVLGPEKRARFQMLLHQIRRLCLEQGGRGNMQVFSSPSSSSFGTVAQDFGMYVEPFMRLPEACLVTLADLAPIFLPNAEGILVFPAHTMKMELPTTLHGVMAELGTDSSPPLLP